MSVLNNGLARKSGSRALVRALLLSSCLATLGGVEAAYAADPAAAPLKETTTADAAPAPSALGEVVVTARKTSENLQTTPVSVTAVSSAQVQALNIHTFQDLRGAVPNLEVLPLSNGGVNLTVRGVGQGSVQPNSDPKVGLYVNDMYIARPEGGSLYFYDVDAIQVLEGPQGTLFGKNTTGGAFLVNTAKPTSDPGGFVDVRAGSYGRLDTEGAINMPISDTLMTRFSFKTDNTDGYVKHLLDNGKSNDIDDKSARFQIRWKPTEKLTVDFLAEYNDNNTDGLTTIETGCNNSALYIKDFNATHKNTYCSLYPSLGGRYLVYGGATLSIPTSTAKTDLLTGGDYTPSGLTRGGHPGPFNDTKVSTGILRLNYDINDDMSIKSISGYRRSYTNYYNPTLNAPNDIYAELDDTDTTEVSQEFDLNGKAWGGRLTYVAGLYFELQNTFNVQDTGPDWDDPTGYTYAANTLNKSYAAFANVSYKIIDPLELTIGARYSYDTKAARSLLNFQADYSSAGCKTFALAFVTGQSCNGLYSGAASDSWDSFDPSAKLSYQVTPNAFAYISFTKGYNAGGINQQLGSNLGGGLVTYNPERLNAYEGGLKTDWFDKRLRVNGSVFYQKYQDIQTTLLVTFHGIATRQVQTGATAHEEGLELEFEALPTPDLQLHANVAYLRQHYDSIAKGVTSFTLQTPVTSAPKLEYSLDGSYTIHMGERSLVANLNWRAVGKKAACTPFSTTSGGDGLNGLCYTPAYGLLGARFDFHPGGDSPWTLSAYGTNILGAKYELAQGGGPNGGMGISEYTPGRPAEFGVEARRVF